MHYLSGVERKWRFVTISGLELLSPHFPALINFKIFYAVLCKRTLHTAASFQAYPFFIAIDIANVQMRSIHSFQQFWLSLLTYAMTHLRCRITHSNSNKANWYFTWTATLQKWLQHELYHELYKYNFCQSLSIRIIFICYHLILSLLFTNPLYGVALEACIKKPLNCYSYNQYF